MKNALLSTFIMFLGLTFYHINYGVGGIGAISFPTSLDTLTNPSPTDSTATVSHSEQHSDANDAIEALEAKIGADGSAVTTSFDYKLSGVTGSDVAASLTGIETLTNKTLTSATLTSPIFSTIENSGTLTLPTGVDTLVARSSTDTLTNKTIDGDDNTFQDIDVSAAIKAGTALAIANGGTGQITQTAGFDALSPLTTTGDVIVFNGTDAIRLPVGTDTQVLTADSGEASGLSWSSPASAVTPVINVYTSSTTWSKPAGLQYAEVWACGAGGGGAGGEDNGSAGDPGAGGGGGGCSFEVLSSSELSGTSTVNIIIGAGGSGSNGPVNGSNGEDTTFSTFLTGGGGGGGVHQGIGGSGGTSSGGDLNLTGSDGDAIGAINLSSAGGGSGGDSFFGSGGSGGVSSNGSAGNSHGGGGGGGSGDSASDRSGGSGANGVVIVTEYF